MCKARQYSDQMMCECGLAWDVNDPEPPECPRSRVVKCDGYSTDEHISQAIGFEFQPGELQTANADDLRRVAAIPEVLPDGHSVYQALGEKAKGRTSPENVSDTLDAVVRLMRGDQP